MVLGSRQWPVEKSIFRLGVTLQGPFGCLRASVESLAFEQPTGQCLWNTPARCLQDLIRLDGKED